MKKLNYYLKTSILLFAVVLFIACGTDENEGVNSVQEVGKDTLVNATVLQDLNASTMFATLYAQDNTIKTAFGYKSVKITYNTKGQNGEDIVASGLLTIPAPHPLYVKARVEAGQSPFSVSMLSDHHGTMFLNSEAPSVASSYPLAISVTAKAGFAGIFPDYIGYGDSNSTVKPYMLEDGNAQASLDMIKASMKYMNDNNVPINYQLFISGYSEGGYVALALAKKVEETFSDSVNLMAVAPMAAPSILSTFGDNILKADANMSVPGFMAFIANSYAHYNDDLNLSEMILDSKEASFTGLFDGSNDITAVHTALQLPSNAPTAGLFESLFVNDYETTPSHKLRNLFKQNDVVAWNSKSKILYYHCSNDEVIPSTMSVGAVSTMKAYGTVDVNSTIISGVSILPGYTSVHSSCAVYPTIGTYAQALATFAKIRTGEIK